MKNISFITFLVALAVSYGFYQLQFEVETRQDRVAKLERQIAEDRETIRILQAEWALLNSPSRLQDLTNRFLELAPIDPTQIRTLEELALREDGLQGAAFMVPEEPGGAEPGSQAPVAVAELPPPAPPIADPLPMVPVIDTSGGVSP